MAIYDAGTASLAANGTVTGVGTTWMAPLTLIRVGATIIFKTSPLKIYTISEIISDTQINVYNPNSETVPAGTGYAILAHDGITVQGLAQGVAETLRYYQSKETSIERLIQFIGQDTFDWPRFEKLATQSTTGAAEALASQIAAAESASTAVSARDTTTQARDATIAAINSAGDASTLVTLSGWGIGNGSFNLSELDFQTFNFIVGGSYRVAFSACKNVPEALKVPSNATLVISVEGGAAGAASRSIQVSTFTSFNNNFRRYHLAYTVSAGVRNYFVRESIYLPGGNEVGGANAQRVRGLLDVYSKSETFKKSLNLSDVADKAQARSNFDVYSRGEVNKKTASISARQYGAIGNGSDNPLSNFFSSLSECQAVYPFVTSLDQSIDYAGIQSAINEGKRTKSAVFIPSGVYVVNKTLVVDYAASIYGEGGQGLIEVNTNVHNNSDVKGTLIISKVATGHTISISPSSYEFGLTLRDFAIWGIDGSCDKGIYLHNVGGMGIVSGVNIQRFPNQGLEIGYIQDTYFNNCSVIQCGNEFNYAVTCNVDSNYVYFNGCHFELSAYLFKLVNCWNFSWNQCHFEVARPARVGATQDDRYYYKSACIDLGSAYRLSFTNNTFIPVDAGYLSTKLGLDRSLVPYFMSGNGSYITFTNDIWLAPEGSIDVGYFSGSQVKMNNCQFISLNPSKPALHIENGTISGCTFAPLVSGDALRLNCVQLNQGSFSSNQIGFIGTLSGKRTSGFLFIGKATCNGNIYPDSTVVHKYLDNAATVHGFDGGSPRVVETAGGDIDLTDYHPATSFVVNANGVTISHIYGSPYGRDLMITTNGTGTKINFDSATLITQGAVPAFELAQYRTAFFKSFSHSGSSVLYQIS